MGYYVKFLPNTKSVPSWKVQFISHKKSDTKDSTAKKPKREWDIAKKRWPTLGFSQSMTVEEAKCRSKQLNAQEQIKRQEEQVLKFPRSQEKIRRRYEASLPSEFVAEFEKRFVRSRDSQTDQGLRRSTRAFVTWRASQRMIMAICVEPSEWFYHTHEIYDYFHNQKMSLRYLSTVLKMANLWGFFFSRKLGCPFLPVPLPRGFERQRLIEANYDKKRGVSRASKPISPEELAQRKGKFNRRNWNWMFLSVWFGLRPKEIDQLHRRKFWQVETLPTGRKVLWVFQTKIVALPAEDRWKPIPVLFDEQHFALKIVESGNFRRPLMKTVREHFGLGKTLYAGRKGFADLMLSKNQSIENISVWMGHSTLQRTWYSYKQRRKFHLAGY